jgi:hypothetical protein
MTKSRFMTSEELEQYWQTGRVPKGKLPTIDRGHAEEPSVAAELVLEPMGSQGWAEEIAQQAWFILGRNRSYRGPGPLSYAGYDAYTQKKATTKVQYLVKQLLKGDPSKATRYADELGARAVKRRTTR